MRPNILTIGLTRGEMQTLKLSLPLFFEITICQDTGDFLRQEEDTIVRTMTDYCCVIVNPQKLPHSGMLSHLVEMHEFAVREAKYARPPLLLFSTSPTREQRSMNREVRDIPVADFHAGLNRTRRQAMDTLKTASLPTWSDIEPMRANMLNDGWLLVDMETTGPHPTLDDIVVLRYAYMANFEIVFERTVYIRQNEPLSPEDAEWLGVTNEMAKNSVTLPEAIEKMTDDLPYAGTPFIFWSERYFGDFLEVAWKMCGKRFQQPYIALEGLAARLFGYTLEWKQKELASNEHRRLYHRSDMRDSSLASLYDVTFLIFERLREQYDIRCPGQFTQAFGYEEE